MDIKARITTFRLQTAQRLLYNSNLAWMNTATALLHRVGGMRLDKHLFLMHLQESRELVDLTPY